ncbi:MAG: transketolase C-terminal domain-containing protein [Patescibacteria group bacterium]
MAEKSFLIGNEIIVKAALASGAELYFGYPITPSTEIMQTWAKMQDSFNVKFLQCEDEMASGFAVIGACLAGHKAFTATGGPGNVLLQDALSMAESMRIPFVGVIVQRGGPSTGSVIYSQQEVLLTGWGGNGEGYRIVYSPSTLQEIYDYTIKCFNTAWTYRIPTLLLTDGYLGKMQGEVLLKRPAKVVPAYGLLAKGYTNMRNCFDLEEEIYDLNLKLKKAHERAGKKVVESESFKCEDAEIIFVAHGIVAAAAREAVIELRKNKKSVGLFRPITLNPFPGQEAKKALKKAKEVIVVESAANQLNRLLKENIYGMNLKITQYGRPALGITPEEIIRLIK